MTAAERKRMVADRCRASLGWRIVHALGSLQLALILLATIALACAIATFAESGFSAKVAQAYIYKAPWFLVWLGVLCVNLIAVTATRWPWERKHTGFIVTHYGIVILLIGAVVGLHAGFEGNVVLRKDAPPISRVTTSRSIIQLESPADTYLYIQAFDAEVSKPDPKRPRVFPVPGTDLRIVADAHAASLIRKPRLVESTAPEAVPGVLLRFSSAMMNQEVLMPLLLRESGGVEQDFFGLARVRLGAHLPDDPPMGPTETRMIFEKFAPVADPEAMKSGVTIRLGENGERVSILDAEGNGATYLREEIMNRPVREAGVLVVVESYWPDFEMKEGRPSTASDKPNNPAVLVRIRAVEQAGAQPLPTLDLAVEGDQVDYRVSRSGVRTADGSVRAGESFALGWADWRAEVVAVSESAVLVEDVVPGEPMGQALPLPGFRAYLEGPEGRGADQWIESGKVTALTDGSHVVRIGYGLETRPLPFTLRLLDFQVPRDEGTETPSNFLATVEFRDSKSGETKTGVAQMNRPASFPGTLAANLTGINYKFSQAEWNPRDLGETTLQVLYDPGWMLKWIGSLMICIGIFIQFYLKPRAQ